MTTWGVGRRPAKPLSDSRFHFKLHHRSAISMLTQFLFLMFENGLTVQKLSFSKYYGVAKCIGIMDQIQSKRLSTGWITLRTQRDYITGSLFKQARHKIIICVLYYYVIE